MERVIESTLETLARTTSYSHLHSVAEGMPFNRNDCVCMTNAAVYVPERWEYLLARINVSPLVHRYIYIYIYYVYIYVCAYFFLSEHFASELSPRGGGGGEKSILRRKIIRGFMKRFLTHDSAYTSN